MTRLKFVFCILSRLLLLNQTIALTEGDVDGPLGDGRGFSEQDLRYIGNVESKNWDKCCKECGTEYPGKTTEIFEFFKFDNACTCWTVQDVSEIRISTHQVRVFSGICGNISSFPVVIDGALGEGIDFNFDSARALDWFNAHQVENVENERECIQKCNTDKTAAAQVFHFRFYDKTCFLIELKPGKPLVTYAFEIFAGICEQPDIFSKPGKPTILAFKSKSVTISWTPPRNEKNVPIDNYVINVLEGMKISRTIEIPSNETELTIDGLDSSTVYSFKVIATNEMGQSQESEASFYMTTLQEDVPSVPGKPQILAFTSGSATLRWTPPYNPQWPIQQYIIMVKQVNNTGWGEYTVETGSNAPFFTVLGLHPLTVYSFKVIAVNGLGQSSESNQSFYMKTLQEGSTVN